VLAGSQPSAISSGVGPVTVTVANTTTQWVGPFDSSRGGIRTSAATPIRFEKRLGWVGSAHIPVDRFPYHTGRR
jgi:hypothetical protein